MLLRARLILFVSLAFGAVVTAVTVASALRETTYAAHECELRLDSYRAIWRQIVANASQAVETQVVSLLFELPIVDALHRNDQSALSRLAPRMLQLITEKEGDLRLDILNSDGDLLYSSVTAVVPVPLVNQSLLESMLDTDGRLRGIAPTSDRSLAAIAAFPVISKGTAVGAVVLALDLATPLRNLAATLGTEVYAVDRTGKLVASSGAGHWQAIRDGIDTTQQRIIEIDDRDRRLSVANIIVSGLGGGRAGSLVIVDDVTDESLNNQLRYYAYLVGMALILATVLYFLYRYMRAAFQPLDTAIGALNALSRGETRLYEELQSGDDEIGRIGSAVEFFRVKTLELQRLAGQRERRRRRQARFIRRQMETLAETLDEEARQAILDDLAQIQAAAANSTSGGDDLGPIAITFERLTDRIRGQQDRLTQLIAELQEALATKTQFIALQQELDIARNMQLSVLPNEFPDRPEIQMAARMLPAKEVGGDFYDFFWIDEHKLGIAVADVSGKGIPAAFFMLISRTLLRATCLTGAGPGESLVQVNNLLSAENEQMMFVTCFYGEFDLRTGTFVFTNCGHNPPLLAQGDGTVSPLEVTDGMALAVFPDQPYVEKRIKLKPGDSLLFFTDGVTEAFDVDGTLFGDDRLVQTLAVDPIEDAAQGVDRVMEAVSAFSRDAPQSDDITCMVLRYRGPTEADAPSAPAAGRALERADG